MPPQATAAPAFTRILVVDDHPFFCVGLMTWITGQPALAACGPAASPAAALEMIATEKPHLVLLDLQLKEGSGFDVLRGIRQKRHPVRVIVVSYRCELAYAERSLQAGAHGYVIKDEACDTLLDAIRTVLDGGIHLSPAIQRHRPHTSDNENESPEHWLRQLSLRERQVMQSLGRGHVTKQIAHELGISPKTVEFYRESLKTKLKLADSVMLVRLATIWEYEDRFGPV